MSSLASLIISLVLTLFASMTGSYSCATGTFTYVRVTEIWRYPVKSMGGESLRECDVCELGLVGDRCWGVLDLETGLTLTGRRTPELLMASARLADGEVAITLPDGREVGEGDADALSSWLGRDVSLRAASLEASGRYENPVDIDNESDWIEWNGPEGTFHDSTKSRLTVVSTATLRDWDIRRFRTNIVVDGSGEDEFVGGRITLGSGSNRVVAQGTKRVDRCIMVTRPQPGIEADRSVLATLRDEADMCFSVGCLVDEPGRVTLGDAISR